MLAKYSPKRTISKKISRGPCKCPHFTPKNILNPHPQNKILDTPLIITVGVVLLYTVTRKIKGVLFVYN